MDAKIDLSKRRSERADVFNWDDAHPMMVGEPWKPATTRLANIGDINLVVGYGLESGYWWSPVSIGWIWICNLRFVSMAVVGTIIDLQEVGVTCPYTSASTRMTCIDDIRY